MSKEQTVIIFTPVQKRLLQEVQLRINRIMSDAVDTICIELGIDKDRAENPRKYILKEDLTGFVVFEMKQKPKETIPSDKS